MAKCETCGKPTEFMMNLCQGCLDRIESERKL